jgi:CHAT domain-containing protein
LPNLRSSTSINDTNPETEHTRQELRRVEKQIEQLLMQLQVRNSAYAENFSLLEVKSESPQPWLDKNTLLIEYYIARDEVLALAVSADAQIIYRNLTTLSKLERTIDSLSLKLQNMKPQLAPKMLGNTQAELNLLYTLLFLPIAGLAKSFKHLIVVPHGPLHYLPFHALYNSAGKKYLVEDYEVSYLPAASQLRFYRERAETLQQQSNSKQSLVIGYSGNGNLPFVLQEAREIAQTLSTQGYYEAAARFEVLQAATENYQVIHLATHGMFRSDAPLFSFLELADTKLLTSDLFSLKLNARLVTLSACESGLNVITGGDELVGISRACLYAGASSLLLSLWRVEDLSTTSLMKDFYHRLLQDEGKTKATALRESQLALLRGELNPDNPTKFQHPYFWAPFFLIGEAGIL